MKNRNRRGMLLLIVLAMLAMFAMVAVAFVVLAGSEKVTALRLESKDYMFDPPSKLCDQGIKVVVNGYYVDPNQIANNPNYVVPSAITWEGLLEGIYGYESIGTAYTNPQYPQNPPQSCTLSIAAQPCGGQLFEFSLPPSNPNASWSDPNYATVDPFHCVGCVMTMLDGPAAGLSTRIVGINPSSHNVQAMAFEGGVQPANGNHYIVNGFPYAGMGFGFSNSTGKMTALAFSPNAPPTAWGGVNGVVPGGVNCDYTAADFQNPLLALAVPNPNVPGGVMVPIPSMHRSDLIAYAGGPTPQNMFRPPNTPTFNGGNPNFNPTWDGVTQDGKSQWDVDNMGLGQKDSVWVDLGQAVRYTSDGKAYKPLFAILCLDMDGRFNINAHGNIAQTQGGYYTPPSVAGYQQLAPALDVGVNSATNAPNANFAGGGASVPLARGQGTGPAEVNLLPLFRNLQAPPPGGFYTANYTALLSGRYAPGTYPGIEGQGSALTQNNMFNYSGAGSGTTYWANSGNQLDAFGSPPDPQCMGAFGLDTVGRPLYISMGGQGVNGPYDFDFTRNAPHAVDNAFADNAYGVAEAERIFRSADRDATSLPTRLMNLTNASGTGSLLINRRLEFTTDSNMVPVSAGALPYNLRTSLGYSRSTHPVDIYYAAVVRAGGNGTTAGSNVAQILPWEVMNGLKMDLNRPFGPGAYSSASNGTMIGGYTRSNPYTPDQPGTTGEQVPQYVAAGSGPQQATFNYSADAGAITGVNDSLAARQLYARHLYTLMVLLADNTYFQNLFTGTPAATADPDGADGVMKRMFAQWAVNVVAYRDHNQVMIPFAYDNFGGAGNPNFKSGGWAPSRALKYTVWGCKRPELLISETLAFHDRRTQDLSDETVNQTKPNGPLGTAANANRTTAGLTTDTDPKKQDPGFNSRYRPQGSLFVELFNPWPLMEPRTPDLGSTNPNSPGVELTKTTGPNGTGSPVWRLIIVDPTKAAATGGDELIDPDNAADPTKRPQIERAVYFVPLTGMTYPTKDDRGNAILSFFPSAPGANGGNAHPIVVAPGGYAVIGSGDTAQNNITYIGWPTSGPPPAGQPPATARWITLNPQDVSQGDPRVLRSTVDPMPTVKVPPVLGIDMSSGTGGTQTQRLSVSEPYKGYPFYEKQASGAGNNNGAPVNYTATTGQYDSTLDIPVDEQRSIIDNETFNGIPIWKILNNTGTTSGFRIIYLQRLADPTRPYVTDIQTPVAKPLPANTNPYRTVDAMTVDLTCFNGAATEPAGSKDPPTNTSPNFEARQRGEKNWLPNATASEMNLWKQEPALKGGAAPANTTWAPVGFAGGGASMPLNFVTMPLSSTLGYLNKAFGSPTGPAGGPTTGDPQYPFPLLHWPYRPFNNVYELLQVPTVSSSRLLARNTANPRSYYGYEDNAMRASQPPPVYDGSNPAQLPYPHLLNFFDSKQSSQAGKSAQLHRIFAYVGIPSRFAHTQIQANAVTAGTPTGATHYFHTPFNRISWYREPGNINLNTITSGDVLFGMMNCYFPNYAQNTQLAPGFWDKFLRSRRGDGIASGGAPVNTMFSINSKFPSRFMQPYRTPGGAYLSAATLISNEPREADVTLLREDPDIPNRPLLEIDDWPASMNTPPGGNPTTPDQFQNACMDYNRAPNFRYQLIQKMGAAASTHSNVFAIWLTVGYFEVTPVATSATNPDGWQLGEELGSDTGDITRHRAFYIFDRSIPVGFTRGLDINSDKAFLLKRFIE